MANYTVVRTDLMHGTKNPADLVSLRVYDSGDKPIEVENGTIVELLGLEDGQREVYKAKLATASSDIEKCVLVASVEVMYDERKKNLDEFINEAGVIARGYALHHKDVFSVTTPGFVSGSVPSSKNASVGIGTDGKIDASGTGLGEFLDVEISGRYTYYAIKVN